MQGVGGFRRTCLLAVQNFFWKNSSFIWMPTAERGTTHTETWWQGTFMFGALKSVICITKDIIPRARKEGGRERRRERERLPHRLHVHLSLTPTEGTHPLSSQQTAAGKNGPKRQLRPVSNSPVSLVIWEAKVYVGACVCLCVWVCESACVIIQYLHTAAANHISAVSHDSKPDFSSLRTWNWSHSPSRPPCRCLNGNITVGTQNCSYLHRSYPSTSWIDLTRIPCMEGGRKQPPTWNASTFSGLAKKRLTHSPQALASFAPLLILFLFSLPHLRPAGTWLPSQQGFNCVLESVSPSWSDIQSFIKTQNKWGKWSQWKKV